MPLLARDFGTDPDSFLTILRRVASLEGWDLSSKVRVRAELTWQDGHIVARPELMVPACGKWACTRDNSSFLDTFKNGKFSAILMLFHSRFLQN